MLMVSLLMLIWLFVSWCVMWCGFRSVMILMILLRCVVDWLIVLSWLCVRWLSIL